MPPKAPAPKKSAASAGNAGPAFPLPPRPKPVAIKPLDPLLAPSVAVAGRSFLFTSITQMSLFMPSDAVAETAPTLRRSVKVGFAPLAGTAAPGMRVDGAAVVEGPTMQAVFSEHGTIRAAAGTNHLLIATEAGLFAAGNNAHGQLGVGGTTDEDAMVALRAVPIPRMEPVAAVHRRRLTVDEEREAARNRRIAAALAHPAKVLDVAAGGKHSIALVLRTQTDAYLDRPGDTTFVPFTQVLTCGFSRGFALGHAAPPGSTKRLDTAMAVAAGSVCVDRFAPVASLDDEQIDRVWAAHDLSFARGTRGLFVWGSVPRRAQIVVPTLALADTVVSDVVATAEAVFAVTQGGTQVLRWRPPLAETFDHDTAISAASWVDVTHEIIPTPQDDKYPAPKVLNISAGFSHVAATLTNGQIVARGDNGFGQLGPHDGGGGSAPVTLVPPRPPVTEAVDLPLPSISTNPLTPAAGKDGSLAVTKQDPKQRKASAASNANASAAAAADAANLERSQSTVGGHAARDSRPVSAASHATTPKASNGTEVPVHGAACAVNVACGANCTVVLFSDGSCRGFGRLCCTLPSSPDHHVRRSVE
jgi:hypothetical protein